MKKLIVPIVPALQASIPSFLFNPALTRGATYCRAYGAGLPRLSIMLGVPA